MRLARTVGGLADTPKGILCIVAGVVLLTTQDAISKVLIEDFHPGEIMFWRGLVSFLPVAVFVWMDGGLDTLKSSRPKTTLLRALLALGTAVLIISSFQWMPLAEALAVLFASPLILTALSAPLLGETVGWRRWTAVVVGFAGVILLTRPGIEGIDLVVLVPFGAAVFAALRDIVTRRLGAHDSSTSILFYTQLLAVVAAAPSLVSGTGLPEARHWTLFLVAGLLVGVAHYLIIQAFRFAEASLVAPFRYLTLAWAVFLGFVLWGDVPDLWMLGGIALIAGSGLYTLHRETRGKR